MATMLTIVNSILEQLREDTVASVATTSYSKLIGKFVNRAKEDLENMNHAWSDYITSIDTTITGDGSTVTYNLSATNDRSWLLRDPFNDLLPMGFDITTNSERYQLVDQPYSIMKLDKELTDSSQVSVTKPKIFSVTKQASDGTWNIEMQWPLASGESNRTWRTYWYVPQAKLSITGTDDSTEVKLPRDAIEARAYFYALNERGEEMGEPGGLIWQHSVDAIGAALETDMQMQKKSYAYDITNNETL